MMDRVDLPNGRVRLTINNIQGVEVSVLGRGEDGLVHVEVSGPKDMIVRFAVARSDALVLGEALFAAAEERSR